jgi:rhodanese-related sulfurtransferase
MEERAMASPQKQSSSQLRLGRLALPGTDPVRLIAADELKAKVDRADDFKLVNALGEWEFRAKHIPGSLHFPTVKEALRVLRPEEEIVVYCSNPSCRASYLMYRELEKRGFKNIRRFEGGLLAWEEAGFPLEGDWVHG